MSERRVQKQRLLGSLASARFVLLGEASHGTSEFYAERARITQELIEDVGFDAVVVEADWPDAYRAGCFARLLTDTTVEETLATFDRFPRWMWANREVADFLEWMREWNADRPLQQRAGFYGIDLYSLGRSMEAVISYLEDVDTSAATRARDRYGCFDVFGEDKTTYAYAAGSESCEDAVVAQLVELRSNLEDYEARDGEAAEDAAFFVRQNAMVVRNAEEYYRMMFRGGVHTWNLRDRHMFETLRSLDDHLTRTRGRPAKIVVWAHNSHLGDARATSMSNRGELNLGQLVREHWGGAARNVGFTTYTGSVLAADVWGGEPIIKSVVPALDGSYERLFHERVGNFILDLQDPEVAEPLHDARLERAIGVIYRPETERISLLHGKPPAAVRSRHPHRRDYGRACSPRMSAQGRRLIARSRSFGQAAADSSTRTPFQKATRSFILRARNEGRG